MIKKAPIRFNPYFKTVIWGGEKICRYKGIEQPFANIGESWEISAVAGHESTVAEGNYQGMKISDLVDRFGEDFLGKKVMKKYGGQFPLLVKLIDANDKLSVQVHPDDDLAMRRHGSLGKTEMWYIISAEENARIYSGLNREMNREEYMRRVEEGSIEEVLAAHESHPGDVYFLPAGRVHAIGSGNFLAEIQENSDITYRIYDYGRKDAMGNTRELHTEQAKDAIDFTYYDSYKSEPVDDSDEMAVIAECEHFTVNRILLDGEVELNFSDDSFTAVMCIDGEASLDYLDGKLQIKTGETVLVPAVLTSFRLKGKGTFLTARS